MRPTSLNTPTGMRELLATVAIPTSVSSSESVEEWEKRTLMLLTYPCTHTVQFTPHSQAHLILLKPSQSHKDRSSWIRLSHHYFSFPVTHSSMHIHTHSSMHIHTQSLILLWHPVHPNLIHAVLYKREQAHNLPLTAWHAKTRCVTIAMLPTWRKISANVGKALADYKAWSLTPTSQTPTSALHRPTGCPLTLVNILNTLHACDLVRFMEQPHSCDS